RVGSRDRATLAPQCARVRRAHVLHRVRSGCARDSLARPPRAAPRPERARSVASRRNRRVLARTVARPAAGVRSGDAPGLAALAIDARRRKPRLAHLRRRLRRGPLRAIRSQRAMSWMAPFDVRSHLTWMRVGIASVWLLFGLFFKALDGVPRHRQI